MTNLNKMHQWAVVGAGPAGIMAVCQLLDDGVNEKDIVWIDSFFEVGDFGRYWSQVPSNTPVELFIQVLESFNCVELSSSSPLFSMDKDGPCLLGEVAKELQTFTTLLKNKVNCIHQTVTSLDKTPSGWQLKTKDDELKSKKVILATGSVEKTLNLSSKASVISLHKALDPELLQQEIGPEDNVAVFGSSHSAILVLKNLVDMGCYHIYNFYQSPCRYALKTPHGNLFENTGLKAIAATWALENIEGNPRDDITRLKSHSENIDVYLPKCQKIIYAVGFDRRSELCVDGVALSDIVYDNRTGIIAPDLFGLGIAFPQRVIDHWLREEDSIGLLKFLNHLKSAMPLWRSYPS